MGRRAADVRGSFAPARTTAGSAVAFVLVMVALFGALTVLLRFAYLLAPGVAGGPFLSEGLLNAGEQVAGHIGWGFGAVATVQFGVLVATVGGQMALRDQEQEAGVRTFLLLLGTLPVSALTPAILLLTAGATRSVDARAALFVAVPVYFTMLAISVFIATFEPGPETLLLERARRRARRARMNTVLLARHPQNPVAVPVFLLAAIQAVLVVMPVALAMVWGDAADLTWAQTLGLAVAALFAGAFSALLLVRASAVLKPLPSVVDIVNFCMAVLGVVVADLYMAVILLPYFPFGALSVAAIAVIKISVIVGIVREAKSVWRREVSPGGLWCFTTVVTRAGNRLAWRSVVKEVESSARHLQMMECGVRLPRSLGSQVAQPSEPTDG